MAARNPSSTNWRSGSPRDDLYADYTDDEMQKVRRLEQMKAAFVGDALFHSSIGRTDLPGGSFEVLESSIRQQIYSLPDDTVVYPGHGPDTTVGVERETNPFVHG